MDSNLIIPNSLLNKKKYLLPTDYNENDYNCLYPFNHYESPYPNLKWVRENEKKIFNLKLPSGINFNEKEQLNYLNQMNKIDLLPWNQSYNENQRFRYYYNNDWFRKGSADVLYYMIRILKPKKIIEVGSGFSTAVMLDTNSYFFDNNINIISIEPNPERLKKLIRENDNITIIEKQLQDVPISFFNLNPNDILFIDSSHISKVGSDVNYYLFDILPSLSQGTFIHFHDIFYPFEYSPNWFYQGRAYNESYLIRAFLMYNSSFIIHFFGEFLMNRYYDQLPYKMKNIRGSLWIKKI